MTVGGLTLVDSSVLWSGVTEYHSVIKHSPVVLWVIWQQHKDIHTEHQTHSTRATLKNNPCKAFQAQLTQVLRCSSRVITVIILIIQTTKKAARGQSFCTSTIAKIFTFKHFEWPMSIYAQQPLRSSFIFFRFTNFQWFQGPVGSLTSTDNETKRKDVSKDRRFYSWTKHVLTKHGTTENITLWSTV